MDKGIINMSIQNNKENSDVNNTILFRNTIKNMNERISIIEKESIETLDISSNRRKSVIHQIEGNIE